MTPARLRLSWVLLLSGACLLAYANALTGGFTYDDKAIVRDNPRIRAPERVDEIFTTQYFGGPRGTGTAYRPILLVSYALQWWIHGADAFWFRAVDVLLHLATTLLLARLLLRLALPPPSAIGAALLFAVHPIHVEAVTSIVGRGETQAAALVLGFLLLALRSIDGPRRRALSFAIALALYFLANLTKESAAVAPALLLLCLAWRAEGTLWPRLRSALVRGLPLYAGCAAVLAGVFRIRGAVLGGALKSAGTGIFELENPLAPLPAFDRMANACTIFFRYLGRLALPLRLSSDESGWSIRPLRWQDPLAVISVLLIAALLAACLVRLGSRAPSAFGFLFLCAAALPTSNLVFPTGTIFAERLAYLPSAGFCLIVASWIWAGATDMVAMPRGRLALLAAVALAFGARTVVRNPVWQSDEALFTNMVRVSPDSAKAHYDFAYMSAELGKTRRALEHYTRATEIYPGYWDAWAGRGRMERALGNLVAAEKAYAESVRLAPFNENGHFGVGLCREDRGDRKGAEEAYREGLRRNPRSLSLSYRLALVLTAEGRPSAVHAWHRALAIDPASIAARLGYARWLADAGRRDDARAQVRDLLRRAPRNADALELQKKLES